MRHENPPSNFEQEEQFDSSFVDRFGLGPEEAATVVSYGNYTGTLAAMLNDERCPVGNVVAAAYEEKGIAGVEEKFMALSMMSSDFAVEISQKTRGFHEGTVSREELLPLEKPPEEPDFLV